MIHTLTQLTDQNAARVRPGQHRTGARIYRAAIFGVWIEVERQSFFVVFPEGTERAGYNLIASKTPDGTGAGHSKSATPGANDNVSGVAALLELARLLQNIPSELELRLIAFDGEEEYLRGSHHYAGQLSDGEIARVIGVVNLDMLASKYADESTVGTYDSRPNALTECLAESREPAASWAAATT